MNRENFEYLQGEVIGYIRAMGNINYDDTMFMFKIGISFLSGRASDIKLSEGIEIVESAVDYLYEHRDEYENE